MEDQQLVLFGGELAVFVSGLTPSVPTAPGAVLAGDRLPQLGRVFRHDPFRIDTVAAELAGVLLSSESAKFAEFDIDH